MQDRHIGYLIKTINDKLKIRADGELKAHKLTLSQSRVMFYISECGGSTTQKAIEESFGISHPTTVGLVTRMEKNGFVITYFERKDKRNKVVEFTDYARSISKDMDEMICLSESKMLEGFTDNEVSALEKALKRIEYNVNK